MARKIILLFLFLSIWIACNILGSLLAGTVIFLIDGSSELGYISFLQEAMGGGLSSPLLQIYLIIVHAFSFIVPAFIIGFLLWKSAIFKNLKVNNLPSLLQLILGIIILVSILPIALYLNELMQTLQFPSWFPSDDSHIMDMMNRMFGQKTIINFILNFILMGIMAAVGEELLFRGIIQQYLQEIFKHPHIAVILTALIFGISHFQVQGMIVRILLGAVLGYVLYYSGSLWLSIFIHFFYNTAQLVLVYTLPGDFTVKATTEQMVSFPLIPAMLFLIPGIIAFYYFIKQRHGQEST